MTSAMSTSTTTSPAFRAARSDDTAAIELLLSNAKLPTVGIAHLLATDPTQFTVAVTGDDADVVAVAGLEVCCDNALLRSVAVRQDWQRHGLGHELVKRVVCEAESRGIRALYLLTMTAEHYFPRFGFTTVSRDAVPPEIANTLEFKCACPATATAMARVLHQH